MTIQLQVTIPLKAAHSYPILIANGLLKNWQQWLINYAASRKIIIISDDNVARLYAETFLRNLVENGYEAQLITFPHGEASKTALTKIQLEEQMFQFGCDRHTLCIALGGGVVGDLAGFTAATYMRGIDYIQVPTSMLAMLDSSVGGKVAVNSSYGKNNIGAFWQPKAVIIDLELLSSLPREQIINGFFEAVKIFLSCDSGYFDYCQLHLDAILALDQDSLSQVLRRALSLKAQVVEADEQEQNLRMLLNFGHTVGHALEKLSNYSILHGFAVGLGSLVEAKIANLAGYLSDDNYQLIAAFLARLPLNLSCLTHYSNAEIIMAMRGDKKNHNQQIVMVLLTAIGQVKNVDNKVAFPIAVELINQALDHFRQFS